MKLLIIGGSDAGISAGLRTRELAPETDITMVLADAYPNFSICGLPFYLSGEIADWRTLAHRTLADIEQEGIKVVPNTRATAIHPDTKQVTLVSGSGSRNLTYDKLVIATGAASTRPDIPGMDLPGVFLLRWMDDSFAFHRHIEDRAPRSIVIIGAGYIGMEMADAMARRGLSVTVVEYFPSVLITLDPVLGEVVREELTRNGVRVHTGIAVSEIIRQGTGLKVNGSDGFEAASDMILVAVGSRPETVLARSAGIETGEIGAIRVNRKMETNLPDIYAAGDCVETWHHLLQKNVYMPLGTTAHKQGRIAGENAVGGSRKFAGSMGTQSVKIFNLVAARTGLKDSEAKQVGFEPLSMDFETYDHKVYYPGARRIRLRITGDLNGGRLLGAQIVGAHGTEISKRIDIFAAALFHGMTVAELSDLDLSYTPPLSSPWDPLQMAAQAWDKARSSPR